MLANFDFGAANVILEAHDIRETLTNQEERELLLQHNPDLLIAYEALIRFADERKQ